MKIRRRWTFNGKEREEERDEVNKDNGKWRDDRELVTIKSCRSIGEEREEEGCWA